MNRTSAYDEFCRRCERQGASQWRFSRMHADPVVQRYCQIGGTETLWEERGPHLEGNVLRVRDLEEAVAATPASDERDVLVRELYSLYWWTFDAFKAKGTVEAMRADAPAQAR